MTLRTLGPSWALALLAACPSVAPDDDDSAAAPPAPQRVEQYLEGTSTFTPANGQPQAAAPVLIHRVLDPADNSLLEDVYQRDENGDVGHFEVVGVIDPAAGSWTLSFFDGYGTFEGDGTLHGEPWRWTSWESTSTYVDGPYVGSYVRSEDRLTDAGLEADKEVFSPSDQLEGSVAERLLLVSQAEWEAARDGL